MRINIHCIQLSLGALVSTVLFSACSGSDAQSASAPTTSVTTTSLSITGQPPTSVSLGSTYYFNANTSGGSGNTVAFSVQNKPSWATLNTVTGELRGTPDQAGTFSNIIMSASDGQSTAKLPAFSIAVNSTKVSVTISWAPPGINTDGTTFDNPAGFVIHYGTSASNLNQSVTIGSYSARSYNLPGLSKGMTYYFSVAAINTLNKEGERSTVTSIAL